jgi:hypothetical protein
MTISQLNISKKENITLSQVHIFQKENIIIVILYLKKNISTYCVYKENTFQQICL